MESGTPIIGLKYELFESPIRENLYSKEDAGIDSKPRAVVPIPKITITVIIKRTFTKEVELIVQAKDRHHAESVAKSTVAKSSVPKGCALLSDEVVSVEEG